MTQRAFLALDGGGSGSRAVLRRPGQPDVAGTGGPANAYSDLAGTAQNLADLAAQTAERAGVTIPPVVAGVAGCRLPEIAGALAERLPFATQIHDDSVTAAYGALGAEDGIVVNLGTGSFVLRKVGTHIRSVGGWGFTLGDGASGAWFGREAVAAALRAEDGLAPHDALTKALIAPHPLLRFRDAGPADFAALAPLVFDHATTPTATRLIAGAITEIEWAIASFKASATEPILLVGGVAARLADHAPPALQARLRAAKGSPLDGAVYLAERASRV
ncbi:MAG: BadF/BadG/BcrA/BcrD ATPase family protein [Pseudomonadota bacterium]